MDDIDYDRLGRSVADHLRGHCSLGLTPEDGETLREFATALRSARGTAWTTLIGILVCAVIGLIARGFWHWARAPQ